jgi:hypothetical protein
MLNFGKREVEAVWGSLTRAVALNSRTEICCAEETGMAPLVIIFIIMGTSDLPVFGSLNCLLDYSG